MLLRESLPTDEAFLSKWLNDKEDCVLVTNKEEYDKKMFYEWLKADDQQCYTLLNEAGQIIAYGEIWIDEVEKDLELAHLIVDPNFRGHGIGKQLVMLLEKEAKKFGFPFLYMRVNPLNHRAIQCYKGVGFETDSQLQDKLGPDWVWLRKKLND